MKKILMLLVLVLCSCSTITEDGMEVLKIRKASSEGYCIHEIEGFPANVHYVAPCGTMKVGDKIEVRSKK